MDQGKVIDKSMIEEIIALTPMQEGMLFHYLKEPEDNQYFEQLSLSLQGKVNGEVFKKSWDIITSRNEMLRTFFRWEKIQNPVQIVLRDHKCEIKFYDFSDVGMPLRVHSLQELKKKDKSEKFDLKEVPFRVTLCKLGEEEYEMIISNHHILFDGWSTGIILKEFFNIYETLSKDSALKLPVKTKFKEFIKYINNKNQLLEQEYWQAYLNDYEEVHIISEQGKENISKVIEKYSFSSNASIKKDIDLFAKNKRITLAELIYCTWGILLQKYTNSSDVIFGTTLSGRAPAVKGIEEMVGLFINTLPLRIKNNAEESIFDLLTKVKNESQKREEFQNTALMDIKKYLGLGGIFNLFDSLVVVENYPIEDFLNKKETALTLSAYDIEEETNYPIVLSVNSSEALTFTLTYNKQCFTAEQIIAMAGYFMKILDYIVYHSDGCVEDIEILSDIEKEKILQEFNDNHRDYPCNKTLHQLFEEQVKRTPDNIALVFEDKHLTYKELNEKSNKLARTLREKAVQPDSIVGIMVERSLEMIVGIMGILKSGGAYLPIDPEYPEDRVKYMLEDSKTNILLTQTGLLNKAAYNCRIINLDEEKEYEENTENLEDKNNERDLAYVIYTSGSTGKPKGVMVEHRSAINTIFALQEYYPLLQKGSYLLKTNYTFDVSVSEIFSWFLCGSKLTILPQGKEKEVKDIVKAINKYEITHINFTPSMLKAFVNLIEEKNKEELKSLKYIFSAGEALQKEIVKATKEKLNFVQLENLYGPTEATVYATKYSINNLNSDLVPIGKPINNTKCFILDAQNIPVPIGVVGELFLGGTGLARGYLNKSELTLEKFIKDPFNSEERIYKTGDLARWLPDGNIEFLGRIDHQVKIRGFRIELGEIENHLLSYESVKEVVVIDRQDKAGDKYLCAYMVATKEVTVGELRRHLLKDLPEYMVPSYFVQLEKMPLTFSGKIDRKALPEPDGSIAAGTEYEGPRNELEEKLIDLWSKVLAVENIGISHNFFDLGGHSLKATALISKIHKELNVELPLKVIFKSPTIKGISEYIQNKEKAIYEEIKIVEEKDYYEVSSAQKRMYLVQQFDLNSTSYNMPGILEVEGNLDIQRLENAFHKLIERHQSLRTSFEKLQGEIVQRINSAIDFKVNYVDMEKTAEGETLDIEKLTNSFVKAFDLSKAPLLRVAVIKVSKEKHIIIFDMHHIISDGVSMGILTKEFAYLYDGKDLDKVRVQYKDFTVWQNNLLKSEKMKAQEEYWLQNFSGEIPLLNMPTDFIRPSVQSFEGDNISFKLDKNLTTALNKISRETGSTMYMVLLSALNILLSKYSGQEHIIMGSPIAGRPHADLEKIIGIFVNTLAIKNHVEGSKNYRDFLKEVKENALRAYENQDYQFEELIEKLNIRRDISRNPLFDVMFTMQNMDSTEIELENLKLVPHNNKNKVAKFDLAFTAVEINDEIIVDINYCTKLFKKHTVEGISEHLKNILKSIVKNTSLKLNEIEMISEEEKNKLLYEFNNTYIAYPKHKTIHELFEEQVEKTPDNIALVLEEKKLTYRELNEKSNSLARTLREKGVKQDSIVGIMVEPCLEMMVGIMAILKAGGAYLPIDPVYPEDRVSYMLEDSKTKLLLTQNIFVSKAMFQGEIIDLENKKEYAEETSNLEHINTSKNLVYVIYTSGSTGKPKGVMLEHGSVVNYINYAKTKYCGSDNGDFAVFTSIAFDLTVTSLFTPLVIGKKACIYKGKDDLFIKKIFEECNVDVIKMTPAHLSIVNEIDICKSRVKSLIIGGEELSSSLAEKIYDKFNGNIEIFNEYGPTEATVGCIVYKFNKLQDKGKTLLIGKPINNTKVYVLNEELSLAPIGVASEIYLSGDGISRGYLNKPELSAEKFIENPFIAGEKMYKSGDLGRWLPDGNIEFLGRIDHQVKIRGFRIELGEIENQLLNYESVKDVIVIDRRDKNEDKYLCAYLVCNREVIVSELREHLLRNLPEYMVPSYFIQLEKMPLTSNGKIDRRALPEPEGKITLSVEYEAPRNEVEEKMVKIWREVLGVESLGINDNFFELGGHSLKATFLLSKIHKELDVEVPFKEIFQWPTIKGISEYIQSTEKKLYEGIELVGEKEYYEVSSAQKRMYMLQQFDLQSTSYNTPAVLEVEGKLDIETLEMAFNKLIKRHETLRTSFENIKGEIVQKINSNIDFKVDSINIEKTIEEVALDRVGLKINSYEQEKAINPEMGKLINVFVKPFDLSKAPLLRVGVIKVSETKHIIMIDIHHIISDGVSMGILTREFAHFYAGKDLEKVNVQYKDYSAWQNNFLKSEKMKKQEEYWLQNFSGEIPVLNMPMDFIRPSMQSFQGNRINLKLDKDITRGLNKVAKETGSTMYMVLLSGINILLSKYSGQEDLIVGSTIAGRPHADFEKIIGMFVNALAMRNRPEESKNYKEFLKEVKENALKAYENQDYQFEELVEKLNIRRDISRNPLFDVMFTMQNMDSAELQLKDLTFKQYKNNTKVAKFDLTFFAVEASQEISIDIDYCTELFKGETIERMAEHFRNLLKLIGKNADVNISELDMLSESERHKLLFEFNDTYTDYPKNKTIHQIFEEQVEKTPHNVAVVFEDKQLTYRELNERANSLAKTLREKGVKPDTKVGVMLERSLEMIVGVMGILKAGGAFLPVAPEYPEDRIIHMLEDSEVKLLLTQTELTHKVQFNGEIINLEEEEAYSDNTENLEHINSSKDLVYVLYTSGSTGKPKGAMIEHRGLINTLGVLEENCPVTDKDSYLLKTNCVFDVSVIELFTWFFGSGKLVILPNGLEKEPLSIAKTIQKNKVTHINFTPSMVSVFFNSLNEEYTEIISSLKYIILGGEAVQKENIEKIRRILKDVNIENIYGPTEFSIFVTRYSIKDLRNNIPIGPPVNNTKCYVLGKNKNLQPVGVVGELCLSGDGVSRGYVNRPELTAEKFVADPFIPEQLMYKTGDLARWLPDGNIEFLGRIDHQVKIRGFRIELGEIENVLLNYESVKEVVVVDRKDRDGDKYLCAYITCHEAVIVSELRKHLLKNLPEYMVPAYFIQLENMPLTSNGKVDRRALPEPEVSMVVGTEYEAPRNEVEEKLANIWCEVLGVEKVGIYDNFFELGGHSLKAIQLTSLLHKRLNIKIGLQEIFNLPTVELLSKVISNRASSIYKDITPLSKQDHYELSYAQRRLWIINKTNPNSTAYNMPGRVTLHENVDEKVMKLVFNELINRHEGLRTRFKLIDGEPVQIIEEVTSFELEFEDISTLTHKELSETREKIYNNMESRVFDLEVASLIYVKLVKIKAEEYDLIYCMHHIISDGFSLEVLKNEFYMLYKAYKKQEKSVLAPLNIQYKDFAAWQNALIKDKEGIEAAKSFWNNQLNKDIPILQLPFSYPNTNITNKESAGYRMVLSENHKYRLKALEKEYNTSLFVVLVTSFNLFLAKLTNQKDILIGTAGFGRDHDALKNIIGCFINTTILRNEVDSEESFGELLEKINKNTLKALEYQNYPIELMLDELNISYPKISAFFNMLNMGDSDKQYIEDYSEYHINKMQSVKFDMAWYITEYANGIEIICSYLLALFEPSRMEYIMKMYMKVLDYILENPNKKLKEYKLTESKRKFSKS